MIRWLALAALACACTSSIDPPAPLDAAVGAVDVARVHDDGAGDRGEADSGCPADPRSIVTDSRCDTPRQRCGEVVARSCTCLTPESPTDEARWLCCILDGRGCPLAPVREGGRCCVTFSPPDPAPYCTWGVDGGLLRCDCVSGSDGATRWECRFDTQG